MSEETQIKIKEGDKIKRPVKLDNGRKLDSPKYYSWTEVKEFTVVRSGTELIAEWIGWAGKRKMRFTFPIGKIENQTPQTT